MRRGLLSLVAAGVTAIGCGITGEDLFSSSEATGSGGSGGAGASSSSSGSGAGTSTGGAGGTGGSSTSSSASSSSASSSSASSSSASSTSSSSGGGVDPVGCSDGTREAYVDIGAQPNIAGCAGGFSVAGVTTPASMAPACNRVSGNDSVNPQGNGCSVEDLCSEGWHVCHGAIDVSASSATGKCDTAPQPSPVFWLTRQVQNAQGFCSQPPDVNNITGCGTLGDVPVGGCDPLDRRMRYSDCIPTQQWFCGNDQNDGFIEAQIVVKVGPDEGGVLCCKD